MLNRHINQIFNNNKSLQTLFKQVFVFYFLLEMTENFQHMCVLVWFHTKNQILAEHLILQDVEYPKYFSE